MWKAFEVSTITEESRVDDGFGAQVPRPSSSGEVPMYEDNAKGKGMSAFA